MCRRSICHAYLPTYALESSTAARKRNFPRNWSCKPNRWGPRLEWIEISGQGPNALDFHIAFYLGEELARHPDSKCVVLSRDTGFDPLIRHLLALGRTCRRASSLKEAFPGEECVETDHFARLVNLLGKEKTRPARRRGLAGKVKNWFPHLTEDERLALIQRLLDESLVRESEKALTYDL